MYNFTNGYFLFPEEINRQLWKLYKRDEIMLNKKNAIATTLYHRATETNRNKVIQCGMACPCETCMYAQYPVDYKLTGYHMYCTRQRKEVV